MVPFDLLNVERSNSPDAGAYESTDFQGDN
jgi:hypothetical protein